VDIGKPRAAATLPRLAELNSYVPVRDLGGKQGEEISVDLIKGFHASAVSLLISFASILTK
jgi:ubiquitin-activating enzyme E1